MCTLSERADKQGLDRSVLTYVDIAAQPTAKYFLIIDESYGKALFSVDTVVATQHEVVGLRGVGADEVIVTRFSPQLIWRTVNTTDVYCQATRDIMEREAEETKQLRTFRDEIIKRVGLDGPGVGVPEGVAGVKEVGQYL